MLKKTLPMVTLVFCLATSYAKADASTSDLLIYIDADWSNHSESATSIARGIETALSEVNFTVQSFSIGLVKKDHSGNVVRSRKNMGDFLDDPKALALFSGIHSPPLIKYRSFINENRLLTLVPWAAGGPITRYPSGENWVFRVSLDDTKVGRVLVDYALDKKQCKSPSLLLESTPWGDSNLDSITQALADRGIASYDVTRFNWNTKTHAALNTVQEKVSAGSDCILLVANAREGALFAEAMSRIEEGRRVPIVSHWGITGGDFHEIIDSEIRKNIDLTFVQSCFSFMSNPLSAKGRAVLSQAKRIYPNDITGPQDIRSPVGFIHGYDATLLLLEALKTVTLTDNMAENRRIVRAALENIDGPVVGLTKTYVRPFRAFSANDTDAHEAFTIDDYCMASYGDQDEILLVED